MGQDPAEEVLGELLRVGVRAELPLGDAGAEHGGDHVEQVALVAHDPVPDGPRLVVELHRGGHERAATGLGVPSQPPLEQLAHARLAPWRP